MKKMGEVSEEYLLSYKYIPWVALRCPS